MADKCKRCGSATSTSWQLVCNGDCQSLAERLYITTALRDAGADPEAVRFFDCDDPDGAAETCDRVPWLLAAAEALGSVHLDDAVTALARATMPLASGEEERLWCDVALRTPAEDASAWAIYERVHAIPSAAAEIAATVLCSRLQRGHAATVGELCEQLEVDRQISNLDPSARQAAVAAWRQKLAEVVREQLGAGDSGRPLAERLPSFDPVRGVAFIDGKVFTLPARAS